MGKREANLATYQRILVRGKKCSPEQKKILSICYPWLCTKLPEAQLVKQLPIISHIFMGQELRKYSAGWSSASHGFNWGQWVTWLVWRSKKASLICLAPCQWCLGLAERFLPHVISKPLHLASPAWWSPPSYMVAEGSKRTEGELSVSSGLVTETSTVLLLPCSVYQSSHKGHADPRQRDIDLTSDWQESQNLQPSIIYHYDQAFQHKL